MFDDFAPIEISTQKIYDEHISSIKGSLVSELFFPSLFAWDFSIKNKWRLQNNHMCFVVHQLPTNKYYALPPIGPMEQASYSNAIIDIVNVFFEEGKHCIFIDVPSCVLPFFEGLNDRYTAKVSYDITESEYIFTLAAFSSSFTKPSAVSSLNHLRRKNNISYRKLTADDKGFVLDVTQKYYCTTHSCAGCMFGCDLTLLRRLMENYTPLNLKGVLVFIDGLPVAFQIAFKKRKTLFCLNKKVKRGVRGINEFVNSITIKFFANDCDTVNYSDDMGIEGLRSYKQRMGEHTLSHKYFVEISPLI